MAKTLSSRHGKPDRTHWSRSGRDPCTLELVASSQSFFRPEWIRRYDGVSVRGLIFFSCVRNQADVPVFFAWSTAHSPDNSSSSAQGVLTSSGLQYSNPAPSSTLRVWLIVLWLVALSEMTAIDHVTTPPPHHHLSPGCLFCVSLCVIQHCHCSSCSQHSAPTAAADSVLHACGRSALYSRWLVIVVGIFFF